MVSCSAMNCDSESKNGTRLFRFPKDPLRRKKWIINCRRDKWKPKDSSRLCEKHFEESQFECKRVDQWKKLIPTAIPTLFNVLNPPSMIDTADLVDHRGPRKRPADLKESKTRLTPAVHHFDHEYVKRQRFVTSRKSVLHNQNGRKDQRSNKDINSANDVKKGINCDTGCEDDSNINVRITNNKNGSNPCCQQLEKTTTIGERFTTIAETLVKYKERGFLCDAILVAKCGKELKAHSALLAACSAVFMTALESDPNSNGPHQLYFPDLEFDVLEIAVNFVYTGKLVLPSVYSDMDQLSTLLDKLKDLSLSDLHGCDMTFDKNLEPSGKTDAPVDIDSLSVDRSTTEHSNHKTGLKGSFRKKKLMANEILDMSVVSEFKEAAVTDLLNDVYDLSTHGLANGDLLNDVNDLSTHGLANGNLPAMGSSIKHSESAGLAPGLISILKPLAENVKKTVSSAENAESLFILDLQSIELGGLQLLDTGFMTDTHNSQPKQTFFCEFCPEQDRTEFHTMFELLRHKMRCLGNEGHKCIYCAKKLSSDRALKVHIRRHMGIQPAERKTIYKCKECGLVLETRGKLAGHKQRRHTEQGQYECDLCNRRFLYKCSAERHKRMHAGYKPFLCDLCGKAFAVKWNLQEHTRTHQQEIGQHECAICGLRLTSRDDAEKHAAEEHQLSSSEDIYSVFTSPLTYLCDLCGKHFKSAGYLSKHVASHKTKVGKCVQCDVCLKNFKTKNILLVHKRIHSSERPFVCNICPKNYRQKGPLLSHLASHSETKPYACVVCSKGVTTKQQLQLHMLTHTGEKPHACELCDQRFTQKQSLTLHIRAHTGERPFSCTICGNSFAGAKHLKSHIRTHSGERPFVCHICDKSYKEKVDLRYHYTRFHKLDVKNGSVQL